MKNFLVIFILLILITSCDYHIEQYGFVFDSRTNKRIVDYKVLLNSNIIEVDSNGFFGVNGLTGRYKSKTISIEKTGYKPFIIDVKNNDEDCIYKVTQKIRNVKLDKPKLIDSAANYYITDDYINDYSSEFKISGDTILVFLEPLATRSL
jgi:hypothetical protein